MWQSAAVRAAPVLRTTFRRGVPIPRCYTGFAGLRRTEYLGIVRTDRECMTGLLNHGIDRAALGILRCWRRFFGRYTCALERVGRDRKSTRLNSSHGYISYAVFCLKKKKK